MVKKQLIVLTRYPVSFITSFAMVFIFMIIFIFAIAMFTPAQVEWSGAEHISDSPLLMAEHNGSTLYIGLKGQMNESSVLRIGGASFSPGNYTNETVHSSYDNGLWTLEASMSTGGIADISLANGGKSGEWNLTLSEIPHGKANIDGVLKTSSENSSFAAVAFYGFIFFMFLQDITWMIGYSLRDEQYQGTLESLYQTPANQFSNLISRVFLNVVWTGLNVMAALLVVVYIFGSLPAANVAFALFVLFLSLMQMFGMGFIFAALTLRYKGSMDFIMNFIGVLFTFTCAMMFPFSALPRAMIDYVSRWIPLSYSVDLFRSALLGYPSGFPELASVQTELIISALFAFVMPAVGYFLYRKIERSAKMKGTLSEY